MSHTEEAVATNTDSQIAVMAVKVEYISAAVERIERNHSDVVLRREWQARNEHVDGRFLDLHTKITNVSAESTKGVSELRAEMATRRAPWWTIVAAGAGALAVVAYLLDIIPTIVNP